MSESNVDDVDRQKPCLRGTTATDEMPENGYFERQKLSEKNEEQLCKSDVEFERENICTCGCKTINEDNGERVCPCGCAEILKLRGNEANLRDGCDSAEPCNLSAFVLSSGRSRINLETEDSTITTRSEPLLKKFSDIETRRPVENIDKQAKKLEEEIDFVKMKNEKLKNLFETCYCEEDVEQIIASQYSKPPSRDTHSGLMAAVQVLQSKCRSKDEMITVLANELRGSESIDRIAENLRTPCLRYTYLDFDQCGLYAYLKSPTPLRSVADKLAVPEKSSNPKAKEEISSGKFCPTEEPIDLRIVRVICNCLLVSWNTPKDIRSIIGYEIRINRNMIAARVRSPTRTTAVLGPLDLSGPSLDLPGLTIITLYAVHPNGDHSELSSVKVRICNSP